MKTVEQPRISSVILEKISDLRNYLDNLPVAVRNSGVFVSYESRLSALNNELSNAENCEKHFNGGSEDTPIVYAKKIYECLLENGQDYIVSKEQVDTYEKLTQQKSDVSAQDVFSEFLASLTKEQWLHILAVLGVAYLITRDKKSAAKDEARTNVKLMNSE